MKFKLYLVSLIYNILKDFQSPRSLNHCTSCMGNIDAKKPLSKISFSISNFHFITNINLQTKLSITHLHISPLTYILMQLQIIVPTYEKVVSMSPKSPYSVF